MPDPQKPSDAEPSGSMQWVGAGVELAATLGGACLVGYWIDRGLGTSPWGFLICAVIGIVGGLYNLVRRSLLGMLNATSQKHKNDKASRHNHSDQH